MMPTHYIATETLYMTADRSRVVREGDPAAASRLVSEDNTLPASTVERFGLPTHGDRIVGIPRHAIAPATMPATPAPIAPVASDDDAATTDAPAIEKAVTADDVENKAIAPSTTVRKRKGR